MNENLNIAEILKSVGAKDGYPLYSTLLGECKFLRIDEDISVYITVETSDGRECSFTEDGKRCDAGECLLFPSKYNRDWSTVKPERSFKPYDKVLVRDRAGGEWKCSFFSHYNKDAVVYPYRTAGGNYGYCIPYEGNEHLVGTTDNPNE